MDSKVSYILGTVTIVGIVGFTVYAIKKSKDAKKAEEEEITLDEARAIVKSRPIDVEVEEDGDDEEEEEEDLYLDEEGEEALTITKRVVAKSVEQVNQELEEDELYLEEDEDEEDFPIEMTYHETIKNEGDEELRHDPNSIEAIRQFIGMELNEFSPNADIYQTMERLYDIPFIPTNPGDEILMTQLIDYRVRFFGYDSKWVKNISMADIITHYARITEFNYGNSVGFWIGYFLEFNELDHTIPTINIDNVVKELNSHTYFNEERASFGLFGLSRESMDNAFRVASRGVDGSVTYEIEFNEFLKSCV